MGKDLNDRLYEVLKIPKDILKYLINDLGADITDQTPYVQYIELYKQHSVNNLANKKVDKVQGKGLSENDFTNTLKSKLDNIEANAEVNAIGGIQVDGTDLIPDANKKVNVVISGKVDKETGYSLMSEAEHTKLAGIPTVNDGTLTIQKNGTTIDTFSANSSTNKTINITVPTLTSELTNNGNGGSALDDQFATRGFVNSSSATNTAYFLGTYNLVSDLGLTTSATHSEIANAIKVYFRDVDTNTTTTNNDYVFVGYPNPNDSTQYSQFDRYKCYDPNANPINQEWRYEWSLNNSSFTADQWNAINSGITSAKVLSYDNHLSNESNPHNVTKTQVGLGNVDNTSDATKKSNFTGSITSGNTGFATGGDVYTALANTTKVTFVDWS